MAIVNGVVTVGVDLVASVATALGTTNTTQSYICGNGHGKTRWWAKYKDNGRWPYDFIRSGASGENLILQDGKPYWKDQFGWCGLTPKTFSQSSDAVNNCNGGVNGWTYVAPTGTKNSPYHLTAFIGYKSAPRTHEGVGWVTLQGTTMTEGDTGVALIFSPTTSETYDLGYSDFAFLTACRFGAFLKKDGASGGMRVIAAGTVLSLDQSVTLSGKSKPGPIPEETFLGTEQDGTSQQLTEGTWKIYPFLFDQGTHYSIPYANVLTLTVKKKSGNVEWELSLNMTTGVCTIKVTNTTSGALTLNNNSVQFRLPSAKETDQQQGGYGESQKTLSNVTLAAGASKTWTVIADDFSTLKSYGGGSVQVIVNLSNGTYKKTQTF